MVIGGNEDVGGDHCDPCAVARAGNPGEVEGFGDEGRVICEAVVRGGGIVVYGERMEAGGGG